MPASLWPRRAPSRGPPAAGQLVATQRQPELAAALPPGRLADAYATLKLMPGATRRDIKRAYHSLALATHPDRHDVATDGSAFQKVKAAYDLVCVHTLFDADLEAVDAELEEQERELNALERKRQKREHEAAQQQQILETIRRHNQAQRDLDFERQRNRHRDAQARLRVEFDMSAMKVRDEEAQKGPPKGVMLEWWLSNSVAPTLVPLQLRDGALDREGRPCFALASEDRRTWIERRPMRTGKPFWLLTLGDYGRQFALHTSIPFNTAARHSQMFKWAHWYELFQDRHGGLYRHDRPAAFVSRAIDEEELREMEGAAHRQVASAKERSQFATFMAQLRADEEKERQERREREKELERLQKQREQAKMQKEDAQERARRLAEEEAQEQTIHQLEYQDAAWKAFLKEVRAASSDERPLHFMPLL